VTQDRAAGRLDAAWHYEPRLESGSIGGVVEVLQSPLSFVLDRVTRPLLSPAASVKVAFGLTLLLGPVWIFWAARLWGYSPRIALVATAISAATFGALDWAFLPRIAWSGAAAVGSAPLAIAAIAALHRTVRHGRPVDAGVAGALAILLGWMRPASLEMLVLPLVAMVWIHRRTVSSGIFAFLFAIVAAVIVANAFWIGPVARFARDHFLYITTSSVPLRDYFFAGPGQGSVALVMAMVRAFFSIAVVSGISLGSAAPLRARNGVITVALAWSAAAAFGLLPGHSLPFLSDGAAISVFLGLQCLKMAEFSVVLDGNPRTRAAAIWALWFLATVPLANPYILHPLAFGIPAETTALVADLRSSPEPGRVLVENDRKWAGLSDLLVDWTERDVVSTRFTSNGTVGAGTVYDISPPASPDWPGPFKYYVAKHYVQRLALLNIGTIVVFSDSFMQWLDRFPDLFERLPVTTPDDMLNAGQSYALYHPRTRLQGRLLAGSGTVRFKRNEIEIAHPSSGRIILSNRPLMGTRVTPGFLASPEYRVNAIMVPGFPGALIAIDNESGDQTIRLRAATGVW
jgi:hypothetical protein